MRNILYILSFLLLSVSAFGQTPVTNTEIDTSYLVGILNGQYKIFKASEFLGGGGGGTDDQTLAEVLTEGNTANLAIDMDGNNLNNIGILTIDATSFDYNFDGSGDDLLINFGATERLSILSGGAIQFNDAFQFPTSDGTNGQVLKTDGLGTLTWQDDTGGGGTDDQTLAEVLTEGNTANLAIDMDGNNINHVGDLEIADSAGASDVSPFTIQKDDTSNDLEFIFDGGTVFAVTDGGTVIINGAYELPSADGATDQVLQTDGLGNVDWATVSGAGGNTIEGPQNPGVDSDETTYSEFWRDTIPAGEFTANNQEWYVAELMSHIVNATNTEFLDFRIRIDDESTTQTCGEVLNGIRPNTTFDEVTNMKVIVSTDPDTANSIVASFSMTTSLDGLGCGDAITVDSNTGNIIVILEVRWDNDDGDTIDVLTDFSQIYKG